MTRCETAANNQAYVDRLTAANALVVQFRTWRSTSCLLKAGFDRMFGPGIALDLSIRARQSRCCFTSNASPRNLDLWSPALAGDRDADAAQDIKRYLAVVYRFQGTGALSRAVSMTPATPAKRSGF